MNRFKDFLRDWKETRKAEFGENYFIVPSELCFTTTVPLPSGKTNGRVIENIAHLALESSSPFSPNDMFWGYVVDRSTSLIQIFSALKSRVKALEPNAENYTYIFPSFIVALLEQGNPKSIVKSKDGDVICTKNNSGFSISENSDEINDQLPTLEIVEIKTSPDFGVEFLYTATLNGNSSNRSIELPFLNPVLQEANMQNLSSKARDFSNKKTTLMCLYISLVAVGLSAIGIVSYSVLHVARNSQAKLSSSLTAKDEKIALIKQKEERAHELDLFSNKKNAYFRGLDQINQLRPDSVLFTSVYASGGENFEIKCSAKSLENVESFKNALENSSLFKVVRIEGKQVQNNQLLTFSLFLSFNKL